MSRVQNDVQQLQEFLSIFVLVLGDILVLGGIIIAMLLMNWELALITLAVIPILFAAIILWQRLAWSSFMQMRRAIADVNAGLQENISGVRLVQGLNRQKENLRDFDRVNQGYLDASLRASRLSSALNPSVEVVTAAATGLVIIFGGMMMAEGRSGGRGPGGLRPVHPTLLRADTQHHHPVQPASKGADLGPAHLRESWIQSPRLWTSLERWSCLLCGARYATKASASAICPKSRCSRTSTSTSGLGKKVALVGPTGAGKTTLVSLLSRLHDVTGGSVTVDGYDVRDVARHSLNRLISVVAQEPFLFSGTVRDNISLLPSGSLGPGGGGGGQGRRGPRLYRQAGTGLRHPGGGAGPEFQPWPAAAHRPGKGPGVQPPAL